MHIIRTAEDLARQSELNALLQAQAERLAEYDDYELSELAMFLIIEPHDTLDAIDESLGWPLIEDGTFTRQPELIDRHHGWFEVTFILSDDGYGLVLYVPIQERTNRQLLTACHRALEEAGHP